jgi:hypothetical protein
MQDTMAAINKLTARDYQAAFTYLDIYGKITPRHREMLRYHYHALHNADDYPECRRALESLWWGHVRIVRMAKCTQPYDRNLCRAVASMPRRW